MRKLFLLVTVLISTMSLMATTTTVAPGSGTIKSAISSAAAGDVLELQTGTYVESSSITIDKPIVLMAGADQKPVVNASSYFKLADGGLTCKGINFSANNKGEYFIHVSGNAAMNIVLDGCEISGYPKYMININTTYHVDSVIINDCYIHDMSRSIIYCYDNESANLLPGCSYFKMTNSTACNMGTYSGVAEVYIKNNSGDTQGAHEPEVIIDHVTMYNFLASEGGVVTLGGSASVSNSIFVLSANGKPATSLAKNGTIKNCLFYNTKTSNGVYTDTLWRDPQFVNASAKDLTLKKNSPAIGVALDGSNLGDPRWGVQQNILAFTMGEPASAAETYDPEYILSWSVNDPAETNTITLEYATSQDGPWTTIASGISTNVTQYKWDMSAVGYGTYYIRGTLVCETPIVSVAAGTVQYKELIPTIYYVSTTGSNSKDGLSWENAKASIQTAVNGARLGDTVKVAAGTYNEYVSLKDGVQLYGSYDPATGVQDINATPSILDGTNLEHFLIVKYDNPCTRATRINSFIIQNADHASDGGGAYIRANCILEYSIIRNCTTAGNGGGVYNDGGIVHDCLFELCYSDGAGGAVRNRLGGQLYNCIIRGCQGKYAAVRNEEAAVMYNCVLYNNEPSSDEWPASGGVYNPSGTVYNCTFANNYGAMYAGSHSDNVMYNCIFWNNKSEDGFGDPNTYISGSSTALGSGDNAGDEYFEAANFTMQLHQDNMNEDGPHFVAPTSFVGAPKNNGEIAAMRAADFSLLASSPLIDKGRAEAVPATDIEGTARPQKNGIDLGAYEYNPDAPIVVCTGIALNTDTLRIHEESEDALAVIFTPAKTTDRAITWLSANPAIATVDEYGVVTAIAIGETKIYATHNATGNNDSAVVIVDEKPIIIIHHEVLEADANYPMENYTIPSFVPFWVKKEAARADSSDANLQAMRDAVATLVGKEEPYCLVANINGDPKTRMAFNWFTNEGITAGEVQLVAQAGATAADFEGQGVITVPATATKTKKLNYAVSSSGIIKATGMDKKTGYYYTAHKALAENLQPGTTYCYRVGYAGHWSAIATFQTAAAVQGEYSFAYMSDSHIMNQEYVDYARWCAETLVKNEPDIKFCLFPGDFVETGTKSNSEWEWERWFEESMRPALYKMPFVPTDGNHDDTELLNYDWHFNTDNAFNKRSLMVKPQFQGITYSFVYGDVLFLVYSMQDYWREDDERDRISENTSAYLKTDIGNWFREQVAAHPECKYRVTLCHKNVFSGSGHQEDVETPLFRSMMLPIFKECEIDLAIQGHDHCYEVMGPVNPDTREPITSAISGVEQVAVNTNTNMTGLSGGTFTVDDGTLYFIGATCGRKRYYPYTREEMDAQIDKHKVTNYFDLFTSRFGQPGAPSYTKFTVKADGLYLDTYSADSEGTATPFNSIKVVRTREHTALTAVPEVVNYESIGVQKIFRNGRLYIVQHDHIYSALGF